MKFSQTKFEARSLAPVDRAAYYRAALAYLKPAFDTLSLSVKANPDDG